MDVKSPPFSDEDLIQSCLSAHDWSWDALRERNRERLCSWIKIRLHKAHIDALVEEIDQSVWVSLCVQDQKRLRAYDPRRGTFFHFLKLQVSHVIADLKQKDTQRREVPFSNARAADLEEPHGNDWLNDASVAELWPFLSPHEQERLRHHLGQLPDSATNFSPAHERKLDQRLRKKIHRIFRGGLI